MDHPPERPAGMTMGPWLQFTAPGTALIRWQTSAAAPSVLEYRLADGDRRAEDAKPETDHALEMAGLGLNAVHVYRILLPEGEQSGEYECEITFNYSLPSLPEKAPFPGDAQTSLYAEAAERILDLSQVNKGYCVVIGCGEGRLAYELAQRSGFYVIGVDTDAKAVAKGRGLLSGADAYGPRITLRAVDSYDRLPFTKFFANLVVFGRPIVEGVCLGNAQEAYRVLKPGGGVLCLGQPAEAGSKLTAAAMDAWLAPFEAQWVGRPGPRAMVDRNPRKPSPLNANGRLFAQGNYMLVTKTRAFVLKDTELLGVERTDQKTVWTAPCRAPYTLVMAGDTLLAGGKDAVEAFAAADGESQGSLVTEGRAQGIAIANGRVYVSTDTGVIHCFQ